MWWLFQNLSNYLKHFICIAYISHFRPILEISIDTFELNIYQAETMEIIKIWAIDHFNLFSINIHFVFWDTEPRGDAYKATEDLRHEGRLSMIVFNNFIKDRIIKPKKVLHYYIFFISTWSHQNQSGWRASLSHRHPPTGQGCCGEQEACLTCFNALFLWVPLKRVSCTALIGA